MTQRFPLLLDVRDRLIVAVGGGEVAARKLHAVAAAGGTRLRVVAPELRADMPEHTEWVQQPYAAEHLHGALLVFAVTDAKAVNDQVVRDANAAGILVNRADVDAQTPDDFVTAATHRDEPILLAVSAGSAALSARLRDELAEAVDPQLVRLAKVLQTFRRRIIAEVNDPAARKSMLRDIASHEAQEQLHAAGEDALWTWLMRKRQA